MTIKELLQVLPAIASHPLAILAYILLISALTIWKIGTTHSQTFLKALELTPVNERPAFSQNAGYNYNDLSNLSPEQRFKLVIYRYLLIGFMACLISIVLIALAAYIEITSAKSKIVSASTTVLTNLNLDSLTAAFSSATANPTSSNSKKTNPITSSTNLVVDALFSPSVATYPLPDFTIGRATNGYFMQPVKSSLIDRLFFDGNDFWRIDKNTRNGLICAKWNGLEFESPISNRWHRGLEAIVPPSKHLVPSCVSIYGRNVVLYNEHTIELLTKNDEYSVQCAEKLMGGTPFCVADETKTVVGDLSGSTLVWRVGSSVVKIEGASVGQISTSGRTIIGSKDQNAWIYQDGESFTTGTCNPPGLKRLESWSSATAVSADGEFVVGSVFVVNNKSETFIWSKKTGIRTVLKTDVRSHFTSHYISLNGDLILGSFTSGIGTSERISTPAIWTPGQGLRSLSKILRVLSGDSEVESLTFQLVNPQGYLVLRDSRPELYDNVWFARLPIDTL